MGDERKFLWGAVVVAAVLAVWSSFAEGGFRRYLKLNAEITELKASNRKLSEANSKLALEAERLRVDPKVQERVAREELGFIKPDEIILTWESP